MNNEIVTNNSETIANFITLVEEKEAELTCLREEVGRLKSHEGCDGCSTGDCPHDNMNECVQAQAKFMAADSAELARLGELDSLRSTLNDETLAELLESAEAGRRLPMTADGVRVVTLHTTEGGEANTGTLILAIDYASHPAATDWEIVDVSKCYSTLEALKASEV